MAVVLFSLIVMVWGIVGMSLFTPVISIIFDRDDSFKAWGIILGDEEPKKNQPAKKINGQEKTSRNVIRRPDSSSMQQQYPG